MTDYASIVHAARLADEWLEWWLTPDGDRWPIPAREVRFHFVDLGIYDAYDHLDETTKQRLPRFWKLMDTLLRNTPTHDFLRVTRVVMSPDNPLFADITFEDGSTRNASLLQVASGEVASSVNAMVRRDNELRETDEVKLAVASGMHPRLGRDSSLRRAEQHILFAKEPLEIAMEMAELKDIPAYRGWHPKYYQSANSVAVAAATTNNVEHVKAARKRFAVKRSMGEAVPDPRVIEQRRRRAAEVLHRRQTVPAVERGLSEPQEDEDEEILK